MWNYAVLSRYLKMTFSPFATKGKQIEGTMESKISQKEKDQYWVISPMCIQYKNVQLVNTHSKIKIQTRGH